MPSVIRPDAFARTGAVTPPRNPIVNQALIGHRLRVAETALKKNPTAVSRDCKIGKNTYSQWRNGKRVPQLDLAIRYCDRYGLTLDWLYLGRFDGLPTTLAELIKPSPPAK